MDAHAANEVIEALSGASPAPVLVVAGEQLRASSTQPSISDGANEFRSRKVSFALRLDSRTCNAPASARARFFFLEAVHQHVICLPLLLQYLFETAHQHLNRTERIKRELVRPTVE